MSVLKKIDGYMCKIEEFIISYSVILMAAILILNVIARGVFNNSLVFAEEAGQFLVVVLTFIGLSYGVRKGKHISMSAFVDVAPFKIKKAMIILISIVTMIIMFAFAYFGWQYTLTIIARGRVTPALEVPRYLIVMFVPIGFFLSGIQYLINAILNIAHKNEIYLGNDKPQSEKDQIEDISIVN